MNEKSILIFGAGKIGRSFIGQLFGLSGYEVVFSDIDAELVHLLNERKSYPVVIKSENEETIVVPNVRAIHGTDTQAVIDEMLHTCIVAVSVGKNALVHILPVIAQGILKRYDRNADLPLNIIIAENMRSGDEFFRQELQKHLPSDFPFAERIGLIETSIGKMVPIMTKEELEHDPLAVFAEPYNELILDGEAFIGKIPDVKGLSPKKNMKAWVDRKAFIHNAGHATAAYYGHFKHPEAKYIFEVLQDVEVREFVQKTMQQSAAVLLKIYPEDFTKEHLDEHIDDLLRRFQNKYLKDTIFRVGQDLPRKLGPNDRFMGIIRLAMQQGMEYDHILRAMVYGFYFKATDENGRRSEPDATFDAYMTKGLDYALRKLYGLPPDNNLPDRIKSYYNMIG